MSILDLKSDEKLIIDPFKEMDEGVNNLPTVGKFDAHGQETQREPSLTIERIEDNNALMALEQEWNTLFDKTEFRSVEFSFLWQATYWKHFHENAELYVLVVRRTAQIVAIAPLKLTSKRVFDVTFRQLELIAASESNYQDLIIGENSEVVLDCVFEYLQQKRELWDVLSIHNLSEFSATVPYLLALRNKTTYRSIVNSEKCVYFQSDTSSNQGKSSDREPGFIHGKLARAVRTLARDLGEVRLERCQTQEQLKMGLENFFELHRRRWNNTEWPSQFNSEDFCGFYMEVVPSLFANRQIELYILRAGETQLGQALDFILGKSAVGQLMAYDVNYSKYSPMRILLGLKMNELISTGTELVDYGSYQAYKEEWTNFEKTKLNFEFYPKRSLPNTLYLANTLYTVALMQTRNMPFLLKFAKYLRRKARFFLRNRGKAAD